MTFARVEALANELAGADAALTAVIEQLALSSGSLRDAWSGVGQASYADAHARWALGAEALTAVLTGAHKAAEAAAERHRAAEQAVVALWSDR